jgi:hypothetical protein
MTDRHHLRPTDGRGLRRLVRPACLLLALGILGLALPATAARADVQHPKAYAKKLNFYRDKMDGFTDLYNQGKTMTEGAIQWIEMLQADPNLWSQIPAYQDLAVEKRVKMLTAVAHERDKTYANIKAFKATAVDWFSKTTEKNHFKAGMAALRAGFAASVEADVELGQALYLLATNADTAGAKSRVFDSIGILQGAEIKFTKALKQLRALQ